MLLRLKHSPIRREPPLPGPQSTLPTPSPPPTSVTPTGGRLRRPPSGGLGVIKDVREEVGEEEGEERMETESIAELKKPVGGVNRTIKRIANLPPSTLLSEDGEEDPMSGSGGFLGNREEYSIATHFVKVHRSGVVADVMTLWDLAGTEAVSGSTLDSILGHSRPGFDRLPSINAFDKVRW